MRDTFKMTIWFLIPYMSVLIGCAGQAPQPIRTVQHTDINLRCADIENEITSYIPKAQLKNAENDTVDQYNMATWIAGQILLFPMLGMDVTGSNKIERNAIVKRMEHLRKLADEKNC